mgnify:CR=1 FL=1
MIVSNELVDVLESSRKAFLSHCGFGYSRLEPTVNLSDICVDLFQSKRYVPNKACRGLLNGPVELLVLIHVEFEKLRGHGVPSNVVYLYHPMPTANQDWLPSTFRDRLKNGLGPQAQE